jgi:glycosyltransferase involved in cell wall biosynthesis
MKFYIVIPAHNEAEFLEQTLHSLVKQSLQPKKIVIVNDNSTDHTQLIIEKFSARYNFIAGIEQASSNNHEPGSKIIKAFYAGLNILDNDYDVICKFDADLIFPDNYLETIATHFKQNNKIGMAGGFCYVESSGEWVLENLTNKEHLRGALKAYRKECFEQIGKLKPSIGWDTVDELLAKYFGWIIKTDAALIVKHLRPTGSGYKASSSLHQGEAMYKMRYDFLITLISAIKIAFKKKQFAVVPDYLKGFKNAQKQKLPYLVTEEQGRFIRKFRWRGILNKLKP